MRNLVLAALAAVTLGSAAMVPQADARCWLTPHGWQCWHPHAYWWHHHHYWRPYAYRY